MSRLREELNLEPVEYPTTKQLGASPKARAEDVMAAFADPSIRAIMATIGGEDQITVLPFLDPDLVAASPKAFSATATTPTSSTGSGTLRSPATTAARRWSTWAEAVACTPSRPGRSGLRSSREPT
jgi:hypothetical protein